MSEIKVNKISQRSGTAITLGNSGTDFQLPSGADIVAQSGSTITIAAGATITNSGTASGFGPTGAVSWNTTKITADPNPAVSGVGYFCDTSSAAFTVTLPAAPSAGAIVALSDYAGTFTNNNLTVGRNGSNIRGSATDLVLNFTNQTVTLIYVDATEGWNVIQESNNINNFIVATGGTITTSGNFKIHTFTGPGTFTVTSAGNPFGSTAVDYLVVAGGGGGGKGTAGLAGAGGGGAGGYRTSFPSPGCNAGSFPVSLTAYPITVGAGGANNVSGNQSIFSTITSTGGGNGGGSIAQAGNGGSGGGSKTSPVANPVGTGNSPPTSPPQGNSGGLSTSSNPFRSAGGGGAGAVGTAGAAGPTPTAGGPGGVGLANSISGSPIFYAGGGGGGRTGTGTNGLGGNGGGGDGSPTIPGTGTAGTPNTGGGGGAGGESDGNGGAGGSGLVIIRYKYQ
jgi:hypothetical protein